MATTPSSPSQPGSSLSTSSSAASASSREESERDLPEVFEAVVSEAVERHRPKQIRLPGTHTRSQVALVNLSTGWSSATFGAFPRWLWAKSFVELHGSARITGVLFFDFPHHQCGKAPNVAELHPVLRITNMSCSRA